MMQTTRVFRQAALIISMCSATGGWAQYDPGATGNLGAGMGSAALGQSVLSGTRRIQPNAAVTQPGGPVLPGNSASGRAGVGPASGKSPFDALDPQTRRRLEAEYRRRIQTEGKRGADRWLQQVARETGRRDARLAAARGQPAPLPLR